MNASKNKERALSLLGFVNRPGMDRLIEFLEKSDYFTAPASSRYHLSCPGGLCQHSLNVYDALCWQSKAINDNGEFLFNAAGKTVYRANNDTLTVVSLLHDICKVRYYKASFRNQKVYSPSGTKSDAGGKYDWQSVPCYTVEDMSPYGHGEKSVMMISEYIKLTAAEKYTIRWHMGYADEPHQNVMNISNAIVMHPLVWFLHSADMIASKFMEDASGNKLAWDEDAQADGAAETAESEATYDWQDVASKDGAE